MEGFPWDDLRKILPGCRQVTNVLHGAETLPKISIGWVGCTNVTDRRQTDARQHIANSLKILLYKIYKYNIGDLPKSARHVQGNRTCWNSKLEAVKTITIPIKINAILLNIKINWPKLVNMCGYTLAKNGKSENIAKSFRGATLFYSHCRITSKIPCVW